MYKLSIYSLSIFLFASVNGQKLNSVELDLLGRYDKHADYTTRFFNRSYTNDTELSGKSLGININYAHPLYKHFYFKVGIGYYYLGIDKIRQTTPFNFIAKGRSINYRDPAGTLALFGTNKYHYDNLNFSLGIGYEKSVSKKLNLIIAGDFDYLFSFSQLYNLSSTKYRTHNGRTLGFGVNSYLGALKKFNNDRNYFSPKIVIPIYQQLYGDTVFGEETSLIMSKWFNGIGLSIALGTYF